MIQSNNDSSSATQREMTITRTFNAPCKLVWKAWTEPEHFKKWWGPKIFTCPVAQIDFRVGGKYLWCMHGPDGKDYWTTGVYKEIVPFKRIVYTDSFADEKGNFVPPSYYGMPGEWPKELLVTVTFEEENGNTIMTLNHVGIPTDQMTEMASAGWNESFDKLAESLKT
jgi:uncharacterized protein YndB with AHSA1/START domain